MKKKFSESPKRSVVKAISYRFIIMFSDAIVIGFITHSYQIVAGIIIFSNISSTILYLVHERVWNGIHWGKQVAKNL